MADALDKTDPGPPALFVELCAVLRSRGVVVREETFSGPFDRAGGYCELRGDRLVLLDGRATKAQQFRALLECIEGIGLKTLGLSGTDLSPALLAQLNRRGRMPWPHRTEAPPLARGHVRQDTGPLLAAHTTLGLGGAPLELLCAYGRAGLMHQLSRARDLGLETKILGGGSNLVVADEGVSASVIIVQTKGMRFTRTGSGILAEVEAGELWDDFVKEAVLRGYRGVECLSGIPGTVGATPIQNVGAYGQEVSQTIESVTIVDKTDGTERVLTNGDCAFSYRSSIFKGRGVSPSVVVSVCFRLEEQDQPILRFKELEASLEHVARPTLRDARAAVLALRKKKSMLFDANDPNHRSCGSFFVNPILEAPEFAAIQAREPGIPHFAQGDARIKVPAAWLIERAGFLRGTRRGPVGLSTAHSLAIVAHDGATAWDVVGFAHEIRDRVQDTFGVRLRPEPEFWGFEELSDGLPVLPERKGRAPASR